MVAFRGSEKKVEDWLTNADAAPSLKKKHGKVHSGFYEDFLGVKDEVEKRVDAIRAKYGDGIPIYFTGHSLGGAVATIAAKELRPDGNAACYTFGAPRIGDYDYFDMMKTPVYRIVNSSDIVPRVPPGAVTVVYTLLIDILCALLSRSPDAVAILRAAEDWLNKLKDYRHFGDLRFLTDVATGRFDEVKLLRNPSYLDVVQWFWRHVLVSFGMPIKSHGMTIYRKKLAQVGLKRLPMPAEKEE